MRTRAGLTQAPEAMAGVSARDAPGYWGLVGGICASAPDSNLERP
jgi:hypothetical protein